jgi:ribosomal protein S6--L-glutamate ligase
MSALLRRAGIPMPRTVVTESLDEAEAVVLTWGSAVLKPLFTSKGRGMLRLSREAAPRLALRRYEREGHGPFYLQEFVPAGGRDVAVAILDRRVLGAYYRVAAPDQWQTTTAAGGHYEPCSLPEAAEELALAAAKVFTLEFTSVDMVETDAGWLVYEVSAFGGFSGLRKALGIDAAALYARHVMRRMRDERA